MLTTRKLVLSGAVLLVGVFAMNLCMAYMVRNTIPRRLLREARESKSARVLALGNSLIAAGFNAGAFDAGAGLSQARGAANLGFGASAPVSHLLLFRYAVAHEMRPRYVVYGFYDFQLTAPIVFTKGDLIGNNAMLYYVEPLYARRFYGMSRADAFEFRAMHWLPMYADRGAAWARVEIVRRAMEQQGMPPQRTNQFGRVLDFALLESPSADDFQRSCETSLSLPLAPAVAELVRQANDAGATVSVVAMPMPQAHRDRFYDNGCWTEYVSHIKDLLGNDRANFIDASAWVEDDSLFDDALHLSTRGADDFSRRLGSEMGRRPGFLTDPDKPN